MFELINNGEIRASDDIVINIDKWFVSYRVVRLETRKKYKNL